MKTAAAKSPTLDEEVDEIDDLEDIEDEEDDEEDRGLSGLVVLLMGIVMLGAVASVVWIAYQQGVRTGESSRRAEVPYVTADPEPLKVEAESGAVNPDEDRAVYDQFEGAPSDPVETIAAGPEEPATPVAEDPISAIVAESAPAAVADDAVADRINEIAAADAALNRDPAPAALPTMKPAVQPTQAAAQAPAETPRPAVAAGALSGSHLLQLGAFGSEAEANTQWSRIQSKLGTTVSGKSTDIERADLGAKGIFYRLRIGPFASASEASQLCSSLKAKGQDCLIKAK